MEKKDVILDSGKVVHHRPYFNGVEYNGATEAYLENEESLSEQEWAEYCAKIRQRCQVPSKKK